MKQTDIDKLIKAGEISKKVKDFARKIIVPGKKLLEIANEIDKKIIELGAKQAFPVNLSINEIAAHSTPTYNDEETARGLLKVDIGVQIEGYVADSAFSLDLENNKENKMLIESCEDALKKALEVMKNKTKLREIGRVIESTIKEKGFIPINNLSGHSIEQYELHSGLTIPNYDNFSEYEIGEGFYAVEPFATLQSGSGKVANGKPSGIYKLEKDGNVRDSFSREVLQFIKEEYQTLPFCSRDLVKKFGTRALIAIKRIEEAGLLHHYPQLVEQNRKKVAQAEHSIIILKDKKIITT